MNYTRRPNRPDGNVYRDMRRQRLRSPIRMRTRRAGLGGLLIFVVLGLAVMSWFFWH
jgi:hypothetical protein